eukprot:COSAG04_NODE_14106_length_580_cov_1.097713_1_plen_76_part_10
MQSITDIQLALSWRVPCDKMLITCLSLALSALARRRSPRRSRGLSPQRMSIEAFAPHKAVASPSRVKEEGGADQRD